MQEEEYDGADYLDDDSEYINVTLGVDIYLVHRSDPILGRMTMRFDKSEHPATVEELTDAFTGFVLHKMNQRSEHTLMMEDESHNKLLISFKQVQTLSIRAPDTLPEELRGKAG